jgi:hypothetical protein
MTIISTGIDTRFVLASDLMEYFVDKITGAPLSAGIVTFYSDAARTTLKPVYQISTTRSPDYTYTPLVDPVYLSAVGTFQDALGNNIVPYYYPFQGTPDENTGVPELYYITVYSNDGNGNPATLQFVRVAWPNSDNSSNPSSEEDQKNFIPNGQFWAHTTIHSLTNPPEEAIQYGSITVDSQAIAQGGWYFNHTTGGTSTWNNSFSALNTPDARLHDNPRFAFNFNCTVFNASDTIRDLIIKWPNSFTFSSQNGTLAYTLQFAAKSNDINTYVIGVYRVFNYGSGGAPSAVNEVLIGTMHVTPLFTYFVGNFVFGVPTGALGTDDNDAVYISLRGPASAFNIQVTDFSLLLGTITEQNFPIQTPAEMLDESIAGWVPRPNPDGSDLYLPIALSPKGAIFDNSGIGSIVAKMTGAVNNELYCDGAAYKTAEYSALGIPYRRLFNKLFNNSNTYNIPLFGTGSLFATAYINSGNTAQIVLTTNKNDAQTATANGASSPGFTITTPFTGAATIFYNGWTNSGGIITGFLSSTAPTSGSLGVLAGTSGMTVADYNNPGGSGYNYAFQITALTAAALGNGAGTGKYFDFSNASGGFRMWFQTATETAPAAGGRTLIKCVLDITMLAPDAANVIATTLSAYQISYITVGNAASITSGNYFSFTANLVTYNVWYKKDGVGAAPAVTNLIEVDISTGQTAAQVATATQIAINSYQFAVPDLRGAFLRGYDTDARWDIDYANRFSAQFMNAIQAGHVGSWELSQFENHDHTVPNNASTNAAAGAGVNANSAGTSITSFTGGTENRPVNMSVIFVIKY